jgi:transposase
MSDYPDNAACLRTLVDLLYPDGIFCIRCNKVTKYYPLTGRKTYSCEFCAKHISPLKGTILENTKIPLQHWFYAIFLMATNKAGTSAAQLQRELGCKYDTAWRMLHKIRQLMEPPERQLEGEVEVDEAFYHANTFKRSSAVRRYGRDPRRTGEVLFGVLERSTGTVKVFHVATAGERVLTPVIRREIKTSSVIYSDKARAYDRLPNWGYHHLSTNHSQRQWVDAENPSNRTQGIENFWSTWKPRMKGTYKTVSRQYLQLYLDEYAWRYSNRNKPSMFWSLMCRIDKL